MSHSKSCRKICCSNYPESNTQKCSYHWKNRFCKLRKQWSQHSKCGSTKHQPEECTYCRSPCDKDVGKFGVAWVAELPDCDNGQPKGWQVEIVDTTPGILRKCKQLAEWLNDPPAHLFDSIKGNEICCNIGYPTCSSNTCNEYVKKPCCLKSALYKSDDVRIRKKCRICCSEDNNCAENCLPRDNSQTHLNKINTCRNKCCGEHHERTCPKNNTDSSHPDDSILHQSNYLSTPDQNDAVEIFRKESCCCQRHDKYFKNTGTIYEIDVIPQKDFTDNTVISDLSELDSKIICAGIRTSQICSKMMEDKRKELMEKREKELNTVIASNHSEEDVTRNLYMSAEDDNQSVVNSNLMTNSVSSRRRSSQFRRKESR